MAKPIPEFPQHNKQINTRDETPAAVTAVCSQGPNTSSSRGGSPCTTCAAAPSLRPGEWVQ